MKKVLLIACALAMAVENVYASPAVDSYIRAIASLPSVMSTIPTPPSGYGAIRNQRTGDFMLLVPREYCANSPSYVIPLGVTAYGRVINGYCEH